jgi:hypothetical protein
LNAESDNEKRLKLKSIRDDDVTGFEIWAYSIAGKEKVIIQDRKWTDFYEEIAKHLYIRESS